MTGAILYLHISSQVINQLFLYRKCQCFCQWGQHQTWCGIIVPYYIWCIWMKYWNRHQETFWLWKAENTFSDLIPHLKTYCFMYEKFFKIFDFQSTLQFQSDMLLIFWVSPNVMAWNHITGPLCGESQGYLQIAGTVMWVVFRYFCYSGQAFKQSSCWWYEMP